MEIVILDKSTLGEDIDLSPIYSSGEVREYAATEPQLVGERIDGAEVAVVNKVKLNEANLKNAKKLKLICVAATGYDNIDTDYCRKHSIALCNVPGYSTDSVAQVTLSMALSLVTHLREYRSFVHTGEYSKSSVANKLTPVYHEISSMKWGVIGAGGIGMKVADIASAIGCEVMICRRKKEGSYPFADIDTICRECDIISVHLPLSQETRGIISRERIAAMKDTAVFINTARGAVADEEALAEAVLKGKIGALGVDVYSVEPFSSEHPFSKILHLDNVCLTPHMAWGSKEARNRCARIIAENIASFYKGEKRNRIV
ncbi:MAG: NAD(P)-dependent oxidoreductase [Ruminococcus sp.]